VHQLPNLEGAWRVFLFLLVHVPLFPFLCSPAEATGSFSSLQTTPELFVPVCDGGFFQFSVRFSSVRGRGFPGQATPSSLEPVESLFFFATLPQGLTHSGRCVFLNSAFPCGPGGEFFSLLGQFPCLRHPNFDHFSLLRFLWSTTALQRTSPFFLVFLSCSLFFSLLSVQGTKAVVFLSLLGALPKPAGSLRSLILSAGKPASQKSLSLFVSSKDPLRLWVWKEGITSCLLLFGPP